MSEPQLRNVNKCHAELQAKLMPENWISNWSWEVAVDVEVEAKAKAEIETEV